MAHELHPLPYGHAALEPHMDAQTVELHWGKHHQSYVTKLNAALAEFPDLSGLDLTALQCRVNGTNPGILNNAGGHYNHSLYWQNMCSVGSSSAGPSGELAGAIESSFGSFDSFREKFTAAAVSRFASGWAFLTLASDGNLVVHSTPGHENPLMSGVGTVQGIPVLTCDVWEHAYYLKYQNRRPEFVESWWGLVNWDQVTANFSTAKTGSPIFFK